MALLLNLMRRLNVLHREACELRNLIPVFYRDTSRDPVPWGKRTHVTKLVSDDDFRVSGFVFLGDGLEDVLNGLFALGSFFGCHRNYVDTP